MKGRVNVLDDRIKIQNDLDKKRQLTPKEDK